MFQHTTKQVFVYVSASSIAALVGAFVIYGKTESIVQKSDFLFFSAKHFSPEHGAQTFWAIFVSCFLIVNAVVIAYWAWNKMK
jgi:hypothetical protein